MSSLPLLIGVDLSIVVGVLVAAAVARVTRTDRGHNEPDQALLTHTWPPPPAPVPLAVERVVAGPVAAVDHLGEMIALLGKAIDGLAVKVSGPELSNASDEPKSAFKQLTSANVDWDPTDDSAWLADAEFGAFVPDRPQVGDAPDIETNPFGVPGLSWPPLPGDVVS